LPADPERPAVVYNSKRGEYLVVWRANPNLLYGQRILSTGALAGSAFVIASGDEPAAAYNATDDQYLVVWSQDGVSGRIDIYGQRIAWDGSTLGGSFVIWSWVNRRLTHPRVAWNSFSNEYFVVWGAADSNTYQPTDIAGVEVSPDGVPGTAAHIIISVDQPNTPDITYSRGRDPYSVWSNVYYVVWSKVDPWYYSSRAIMGAVGRYGGTGWGAYEYLSERRTYVNHGDPAVAANQDYFFATWRKLDYVSSGARIESVVINQSGTISTIVLPISPPTEMLYSGPPSVATAVSGSKRKFLVVWVMPTIVGRSILASQCWDDNVLGIQCEMNLVRAETIGPYSFIARPTAAAGGPSYLMAYGASTASQQIYGRLFWLSRLYLPLITR
jgi:hypothetical protein